MNASVLFPLGQIFTAAAAAAAAAAQFYQSNDVAWISEDKVACYSPGGTPPDRKLSKSEDFQRAIEEVELEVTLRRAEEESSSCPLAAAAPTPRGRKRGPETEEVRPDASGVSVSPCESKRYRPDREH
eukprot:COSAG06_NODE_13399_length_1261_cov_0.927711_1_plen_127_part_10